jgi:hypothetical protein
MKVTDRKPDTHTKTSKATVQTYKHKDERSQLRSVKAAERGKDSLEVVTAERP